MSDPRCADKRRITEIVPANATPRIFGWTDRDGSWNGDRVVPRCFVRGIFGSGGAGCSVLPARPTSPNKIATEVIEPAPVLGSFAAGVPTLRVTIIDSAVAAVGVTFGGVVGDPASNRPKRMFGRIEDDTIVDLIDPEPLRRRGQILHVDRIVGATSSPLGHSCPVRDMPERSLRWAQSAGIGTCSFDWLIGASGWLVAEVNSEPWIELNWWLGYRGQP